MSVMISLRWFLPTRYSLYLCLLLIPGIPTIWWFVFVVFFIIINVLFYVLHDTEQAHTWKLYSFSTLTIENRIHVFLHVVLVFTGI